MSKTIPTYVADHELAALLKAIAGSGKRLRVEAEGEVWVVTVSSASTTDDVWQGYDPEAVREALEGIAGLLPDVDADAWIRQMKEEREQDTPDRRFP